jgi:spore coat protein U-like protein
MVSSEQVTSTNLQGGLEMKKFSKYFVVLFLVLGVALFVSSPSVFANTATGSLTVTVSVASSCAVGNSSLSFGFYDTSSSNAAVNGKGAINVTCTNGTPYSISLDAGQANGNQTTVAAYAMGNGLNNWLAYNLSTTPNITGRVVPNVTDITGGLGQGTGVQQNIPIYGQIVAGQTSVAPGNYTDTVAITINY